MTNFFSFLERISFWACWLRSGLKLILHLKTHCFILERSLLSFEIVITDTWITENREVLPAKILVRENKASAKSLIYIKNNNGPKMEPWGAPALTLVHEEDYPLNTTHCFLFVKNYFKTFNKLLDIPLSCTLNTRPSSQTLSNAF